MRTKPSKQRRPAGQQDNNRFRNIAIGAAILLGLAALAFLLYLNTREPESLDGLRRIAGLERAHDEQVDYSGQELPPVGGIHSGVWQNCGIYEEPILAKNAIHSMEHGAVWIAYHPNMPAGDVETLQDAVRDRPFVLLSPYGELNSPVVLTAWGIQLEVDSADDDRIPEFIERYERGPQTPEFGAPCSDGMGTPIN